MTDPPLLVAITGSVSQARTEELGLKNIESAQQAAQDLGRALAERGCHIVVYSSQPNFAEVDVVRGYAAVAPKDGRIRVHYPSSKKVPDFEEASSKPELFDFTPDIEDNWEHSYYLSLADVDAILAIGGGSSTYLTGLFAIAQRAAVVAIATFGGSAEDVWRAIEVRDVPASKAERALMAQPVWRVESAARLIDALLKQHERLQERARYPETQEKQYMVTARNHSFLGLGLFLLVTGLLTTMVPSVNGFEDWWPLLGLIILPALAGASGASIRIVADWKSRLGDGDRRSASTTLAIGMFAGGAAGFLLLIAQLISLPSDRVPELATSRLMLLVVATGLIAGYTWDAVLERLASADILRTEALGADNRRGLAFRGPEDSP